MYIDTAPEQVTGKPALSEVNTKVRYEILKKRRNATEMRAREYAKYTLPYLNPEVDGENNAEVVYDLNGIGPRAVQHLANTYMVRLFPPNRSFFKLELPPEAMEALRVDGRSAADVAFDIARIESTARKQLGLIGARTTILECLLHLIVSGNVLHYYPKDAPMQAYAIDSYVVRRGLDSSVYEIITRDMKALIDLPQEYQDEICVALNIVPEAKEQTEVQLFTHIQWDGSKYHVSQAVEHLLIGTPYTVKKDALRWMPLTWKRTRRETYGRGLVEDYLNPFHALSILDECLITAAAIATDIKYFVEPGSTIDIPSVTRAPSGSYHYGERDAVNPSNMQGKMSDIGFIQTMIDRLERLIGAAFMMNSAMTRDVERYTRAEMRMNAQELETSHGGVYSMMNQEWLDPIARLTLMDIDLKLGDTDFEPVILTGLDAMGRMATNDNIMLLFEQLTALQNVPEAFQREFDPMKLVAVLAAGLDVDYTTIQYTPDEKKQRAAGAAAAEDGAASRDAALQGVSRAMGNASPDEAMAMAQVL